MPARLRDRRVLLALRVAHPWAATLLAIVIAACEPTAGSSSPDATAPPSSSPSTPAATSVMTYEPTATATPETAALVIHMTNFGDTGSSGPGTTILADGRVIWSDNFARAVESRLGSVALAQIVHELETSVVLDRSANYFAKPRPGPEPPGHGVGGYEFDVVRDGQPIVVVAQDPRSFAGEAAYWVIPPEMDALAELADRLNDPVAWLGSDAFVGAARPYRADRFLVEIHLYRSGGFGAEPDVDAVDWPFGEPIESVGAAFDSGIEGLESRCLTIDATVASLTVAAELATDVGRDLQTWKSSIEYEWPRAGGSVIVDMTAVLPYETGPCAKLATTPP
jgi:hypothetical protein